MRPLRQRIWLAFIVGFSILLCIGAGTYRTPHGAGKQTTFAGQHVPLMPRQEDAPLLGTPLASSRPGNFPFQTAKSTDGKIILHYYKQPAGFSQQILALVTAEMQHPIQDTLGFGLQKPVDIYIYASRADFLAGANPQNSAETGAFAIPAASAIYLPISAGDDPQVYLPHELTHIVFHQYMDVGNLQSRVFSFYPLWLDEGLAASDEITSQAVQDYTHALQYYAQNGQLVDMFQQFNQTYPTKPETDFLCYAEARGFITYLIATNGRDAFHRFLALGQDGDLLLAAETVYGADLQTLRASWETSVGAPPTPHDGGIPLAQGAPIPYQPGKVSGSAATLTPFPVAGSDQFMTSSVRLVVILTIIAVFSVCLAWLLNQRRQQQYDVVSAAEALLHDRALFQARQPPTSPGYGANALYPVPQPVPIAVSSAPPPKHVQAIWWPELALVALLIPVALLMGMLWVVISPAHEWQGGYQAAAFVAGIGGALIAGLALRALVRKRLHLAHGAGVIIALIAVLLATQAAGKAGLAQGNAYTAAGAYALAHRTLINAGASPTTIASNDEQWAEAAYASKNYDMASFALRQALAAYPAGAAAASRELALLRQVDRTWSQHLVDGHQFAQAVQIYDSLRTATFCTSSCAVTATDDAAAMYFAWSADVLRTGDVNGAVAKVRLVVSRYPTTHAASTAQLVLANMNKGLAEALVIGQNGDHAAMNLLLSYVLLHHGGTDDATTATEVPVPVTGIIKNTDALVPVAGQRLFLLGFPTADSAHSFAFDFNNDTSVMKIATTVDATGGFQVQVPPGYWYVPLWENPTVADSANRPTAKDNAAFYVAPLASRDVGEIVGN